MTTTTTERPAAEEQILRIEINFPVKVAFPDQYFQSLVELVSKLCDDWQKNHPGRVMWPAGMGYKITQMPITQQDDIDGVPMKFADDTIAIDCYERADFKTKCAKCGMEQGDHKDHYQPNPPAGDCEFTLTSS